MLREELVNNVVQVVEKRLGENKTQEEKRLAQDMTLTGFFNCREAVCAFLARNAVHLRMHPAPTKRHKVMAETLENLVETLSTFGQWATEEGTGKVVVVPDTEGEENVQSNETEGTTGTTQGPVSDSQAVS